ncbi:alpha/beta hydrolase [Nocardiopsis coralli]|nr:alpha/beta hydrolase [Nocardiopsis coralli]
MPNLYKIAARATGRVMSSLSRHAPASKRTFSDLPADVHDVTVPTRHGPVRVTVYRPSGATASTPVHVNVHGGGFVIRHPRQDDAWCRYLMTHADVVVLNVDYDTAPQYPFPVSLEQVHDVAAWAADPAREWDGSRLSIGGQSAGGSLSAAVARMSRDEGGPALALQVLHYPVLDMVTPMGRKPGGEHSKVPPPWMNRVFGLSYAPDAATRKNPLVSPAWGPNSENLGGLAPAVVVTAEFDALRDEAVRYARALEGAGVLREHHDVPGVDHGYDIMDRSPDVTAHVYSLLAGHVRQALHQP